MERGVNKHLPIDVGHLRGEPAGTVLDTLIKEAKKHGFTSDEVSVLVRELTLTGTDEHFWKVISLYADTQEVDLEDKRQVRYGISDIITGPNDEPSKYTQVFDINGELLGEAEVYLIGYEEEE